MSLYSLLDPQSVFLLSPAFNFLEYIEVERELWALFPETDGKRVNFVQIGLTAQVFVEDENAFEDDLELDDGETFLLMPFPDYTMRPMRMKAGRRLTLSEYRMAHLTAVKLVGKIQEAASVMREVSRRMLGPEVMEEVESRQLGSGG